ncbi:MAG: NAD-dependent epimerase [Acidobacteria bacterium]|jgi:CDP-paratose 2-epimerase|nr:NAD-dependent epimerase [Acidobacteriota bacterium]MDP7608620.1 NAD-dependent epimerase/dehydratase family protein [Candidatus Neomarinimicrobiota bacterium]|tara:strand:+ start:1455 stop:2519 length:1065 start_codon:yes stop_codon:yes gene_type:complete
MKTAIITGSAGLIGSESVRFFAEKGFQIVGIDNDMRKVFFGEDASTNWNRDKLKEEISGYIHYDLDIRDKQQIERLFLEYNKDIELVIHAAAQPSHDWAAMDPFTDFTVNANGTLNLLEMTRKYCFDAVFIFTSTNKVYGDLPNFLPLIELETRWEIDKGHKYFGGIDETMSIDQSKHSLFGASKVAADILVQEYGRYFDMKTGVYRGGCLTGPSHSGTMLHGFLSYLMKCCIDGESYTIYGYKGKQVRDNIHSYDLVNALYHFYLYPRKGEVYNIGGGRSSNCSVLEAIKLCEEIAEKKLKWTHVEENRIGDHIWYISNLEKIESHFPDWKQEYDLQRLLEEMYKSYICRCKV